MYRQLKATFRINEEGFYHIIWYNCFLLICLPLFMTKQISILSVSQLNRFIKQYLENEIGYVTVEGELSNVTKATSGHYYFTLKDNQAQIRCVFFKNRHLTPFCKQLKEGIKVIAKGKTSLYEARGDYQLIIDELQEAGVGDLFAQFEVLKNKLTQEGLFAAERKRPLPRFPKNIGIITSPTGAALQDMLSTLNRRFPLASIFIFPSEVQGATAHEQLIKAILQANQLGVCDVLLLARGGGSIEDLWAFNNEALARCIAASKIPVISGVGHETDFTIADFAADYRAETPTAAAARATPHKDELAQHIEMLCTRLHKAMSYAIQKHQTRLTLLTSTIHSPYQMIAAQWQKVDYLEKQLFIAMNRLIHQKKNQLNLYIHPLQKNNPIHYLQQVTYRITQLTNSLTHHMESKMNAARFVLKSNLSTLHAVSPLATLDRGYSITSHHGKIIDNVANLKIQDAIHVRLAKGSVECSITHIYN